jgi:riboflavin synthase
MFTGIVRAVGTVEGMRRTSSGSRLVVSVGEIAGEIAVGCSVSVAGACLTISEISGARASFDVVEETLRLTTLGGFAPGRRVNLEPALRAGEPFGGHFVTGHVDGVARLLSRTGAGEGAEATFELKPELLSDVVHKGSVAVDGVSLTVAGLEQGGFRVALVPHTMRETTLGDLAPGAEVNVETDLLVKAVRRVLVGARGGISEEFLRDHGFA